MKFLCVWRLPLLLLILGCSLSLLACGSPINKDNFDKIETGMTTAEVQRLLGPPTESSSVDVAVFSGGQSVWRRGDITITVQFVNGKVVAKQFTQPNR